MNTDIPGSVSEAALLGAHMESEIESQPEVWEQVLAEPAALLNTLPGPNDDVVVVGCGTSYYVGEAYARHREVLAGGITRAVIASEFDRLHSGETVLVISRSGTTPTF